MSSSQEKILRPHYSCSFSRKHYHSHKRLYCSDKNRQWIKKRHLLSDDQNANLITTELAMEECDFQPEIGNSSTNQDNRPPIVDFDVHPAECFEPYEDGAYSGTGTDYEHLSKGK